MEEFLKKINNKTCNNSISNLKKKLLDKSHLFNNIKSINNSLNNSNDNIINNNIRKILYINKGNKINTSILYFNKNKIIDVKDNKSILLKKLIKKKISRNAQYNEIISIYNNNNKSSKVKAKIVVHNKIYKGSLIRNNAKQNKKSINLNEQKMDISTGYLFKNSIENKKYHNKHNILNLNEKRFQKYNCNKNNNNNTSIQSLNKIKKVYSIKRPNDQKDISINYKYLKAFNLRKSKAPKTTFINISLFKKNKSDLSNHREILNDDSENSSFLFLYPKKKKKKKFESNNNFIFKH